jgi:FAD/FMN-containing dehydrogenase
MTPVTAVSLDGKDVPLDMDRLAALRPLLRGALLLPGDPGYDDSRSVWNGMIQRRPAAIVRALGTPDVIATVALARELGVLLSIKGGGHNIAGLAVADGGLMLDMSAMRGVWVDAPAKRAYAQAGCLLGDVDRETQVHGLAAVLGFVSATGCAGLTLGGGFGYLTRRFGWTSDRVRSMSVVTADGRCVRASALENADLFWALRGGGGNFGVVTGIEYDLFPVGPEIVGGAIAWPASEAPAVLEMARKFGAEAPPEMAVVGAMRLAPPAPWIRPEFHGKPIVALFVCHTGPIAEAERAVAPIKAFGQPVGDILQRRTYVSQQALLDATQPKGRRYYWKSEYLPRLEPALLEKYRAHAATIISPHSAILLFPLGEKIGMLSPDHSAVGNRDAVWVLNVASSWDKPEDDAANIEWTRAVWSDLRSFSTGGTYVNFLTEDEPETRMKDAYGANFGRLAQVKATWDPENVFRVNKNVKPEA